MRGTSFNPDSCSAWIRSFLLSGSTAGEQEEYPLLAVSESPASFGEDADGDLEMPAEAGNVCQIVLVPVASVRHGVR